MYRTMLIALMVVVGSSKPVEGQSGDTPTSASLREAVQLLQGHDTMPFLDPIEVRRLARVVSVLRESIPEVSKIWNYADKSYLVVNLNELGSARADSRPRGTAPLVQIVTARRVGVPAVDSLNRALGADSVTLRYIGTEVFDFIPHFRRIPNVSVLAGLYRELPEVRYAGFDSVVGGGDSVQLFRNGEYWYFVFIHGYGDCPAGCTDRDYYFVRYSPAEDLFQLTDTLPD